MEERKEGKVSVEHPAVYARTKSMRYRMEGSNCPACHIVHFPPREVCPDCGNSNPTIKIGGKEIVVFQRSFIGVLDGKVISEKAGI